MELFAIVISAVLAGLVGLLVPELYTARFRPRFPWLVAERRSWQLFRFIASLILLPCLLLGWGLGITWLWLEAGAAFLAIVWLALTEPQ